MDTLTENIAEALDFINKRFESKPEIGIVLGTGLGGLVSEIEIEVEIPYNFIPHFPISTVESHFGKLIFGKLDGKNVVAMQGRFHLYEGYSMKQITFPIRVMKMLGIKALLISNAAGGLNPDYQKGDLMILDDHINLLGDNPLIGTNNPEFGPRFPDMSEPYSQELIANAVKLAEGIEIGVHKGVYVAVSGPSLETRAEYRFLSIIGADAVGMSTIPEVIVAKHMGIKTFAISIITDLCDPDNLEEVSVEEIIAVAEKSEPHMTKLMSGIIRNINL